MSQDSYDVAQICMNGHVINSSSLDEPQFNQKFCARCGEETTTVCPACRFPIRGRYRNSMPLNYTAPAFCINCGNSYPWLRAKKNAAHALADALRLSRDDMKVLDRSID